MRQLLLALAIVGSWGGSLRAQIPAAVPGEEVSDASFEVASVKANTLSSSEPRRPKLTMHPSGHFEATWATLTDLIMAAYDLKPYEIVDGPAWITRDRFDISAKAPDGFRLSQTKAMLRHLLVERFGLSVRNGTRRAATYSLEWADSNRKFGPGIRPPSPQCDDVPPRASISVPAAGNLIPKFECRSIAGFAIGWIYIRWGSLASLPGLLSNVTRRPVVDKVGLRGTYDLDLKWSTQMHSTAPRSPELRQAFPDIPDELSESGGWESIFKAVREQLGLKLEPSNGEIPVLEIVRVEPPSQK